jgi:hypothetical protein
MDRMKTLYLELNAGLGNRIRAMISGICWAERLCRRLVIWWPVKPECAAGFSILFNGSRLPDWIEIRDTQSSEIPTQILSPDDARIFFEGKEHIDALHIKSHGCFWSRTDGVLNITTECCCRGYLCKMEITGPSMWQCHSHSWYG